VNGGADHAAAFTPERSARPVLEALEAAGTRAGRGRYPRRR
jgi:hypothetical protein